MTVREQPCHAASGLVDYQNLSGIAATFQWSCASPPRSGGPLMARAAPFSLERAVGEAHCERSTGVQSLGDFVGDLVGDVREGLACAWVNRVNDAAGRDVDGLGCHVGILDEVAPASAAALV